jgi:signal transduction histidine kinase/CheY-like chemotaxis protein
MASLSNLRLNWLGQSEGLAPKNGAAAVKEAGGPAPEPTAQQEESARMETVGRLVGAVAHDFANILTLIAGYSDIALNRINAGDPVRAELDEIRKAANRGARLTAQLLGFTRGQAVQPRPLDLNALICEIERMLRLIIGEGIELQLDLSPTLHKVLADTGQMEQVIMNLVLNARDAISSGGRVRLETADWEIDETLAEMHGLRPGPCVTLSVTDNGHGISPAAISHIFEPFFTTKECGKGTGLGLSTVYRIVKENGGDIWVDSAPGDGASFTVCLPQAGGEVHHPDNAGVLEQPESGSETLLIVEDEDGVRRLLTHILTRRGYKVLEASDGEEALRVFEKRSAEIGLVLPDMVMPRLGGRQLGELLQEIRPGVKILYMSGYTDDVLARSGALSPGMLFLQKPLRPEVLTARVRQALDAVASI